MTATRPVVSRLRSRPEPIKLGKPGEATVALRVQMPEVWDVVRVEAPADLAVRVVKEHALRELYPDALLADDFVLKLNGFEVLDESLSVAECGARNGSTFLVTHRRRLPVR